MLPGTVCMSLDTTYKSQDTPVCHRIFFLSHDTFCKSQDTFPMLRDTACMLQHTFGVTHIAARKHEREVDWLGRKRDAPFQLLSQRQKYLFECSKLEVGLWQKKNW